MIGRIARREDSQQVVEGVLVATGAEGGGASSGLNVREDEGDHAGRKATLGLGSEQLGGFLVPTHRSSQRGHRVCSRDPFVLPGFGRESTGFVVRGKHADRPVAGADGQQRTDDEDTWHVSEAAFGAQC